MAVPAATPRFELLALPDDALLLVLRHSDLGPTELSRLEQCCRQLRELVDDSMWKTVFLRAYRANVLAEPASWKEELARRTTMSRGWRHVSPESMPPRWLPLPFSEQTGTLQKLKQGVSLTMTGFGSWLTSPPAPAQVHIVDSASTEPDVFNTISAAVESSKPGDMVLVKPGRCAYSECVRLDKCIELKGFDRSAPPVLVGVDGPVIVVCARSHARVANMSIEQSSEQEAPEMSAAVLVIEASTLVLEECSISSQSGHCVAIQGSHSCGFVLHNVVSESKGVGVLVRDRARALIEDNEICSNGHAGVAIVKRAYVSVRSNKIHSGLDSGVMVRTQGKGLIEGNDIFNSSRAGVAILEGGAPLVMRNKIHHGSDSGVLVVKNARGSVCENEIFANKAAGIAVGADSVPTIAGNIIHGCNAQGLHIAGRSMAKVSANTVYVKSGGTRKE